MESIREVAFGSPEYHAAVQLRNELLRLPLGLDLLKSDLSGEAAFRHFAICRDGALPACLMVVPCGDGETVRIRQMAVRADLQGTGLGRRLMEGVEAILRRDGVKRIYLNARLPAVGFYGKLGYRPTGGIFTDVGIPHQRMEKAVSAARERA